MFLHRNGRSVPDLVQIIIENLIRPIRPVWGHVMPALPNVQLFEVWMYTDKSSFRLQATTLAGQRPGPNLKVSVRSVAKRLVAPNRGAVRQLLATTDQA
jgi:hypothetical protein